MTARPGTDSPTVPGLWLYPALLALHVAEEAPGFTRWAQRHAWQGYSQRDFVRINGFGLLSTAAASVLISRSRDRRLFLTWYTAVLTQQAVFNPVFHAGATVAFREYSPGLVSAFALPPLWGRVTAAALDDGRLRKRDVVAALIAGGAVHAAAVARQVFGVGLRSRRGRTAGARGC